MLCANCDGNTPRGPEKEIMNVKEGQTGVDLI